MRRFKDIREADLERLLVGTSPAGDAGLVGVAGRVRDIRSACAERPVSRNVEEDHVAAMVATAQLLAANGGPADSPRLFRRPRPMRLGLKLAAASAALLLLFAGLALAGTLPGPIRGLGSRAASAIGIHQSPPGLRPAAPAAGGATSPTAVPSSTAKPSPTARLTKAPSTHEGQKTDATGGESQTGGQQRTKPEDRDDWQAQPQDPDGDGAQDQSPSQGDDPDDGQHQPPPQDDAPPQDEAQPQDQSVPND
jgi:hypothetical protein